jgi:hypothetical protein
MPRSSLFTDREIEAIAALATESACDRYRTDPSSLRPFLRERLRLSAVESEAVSERCQKDAAYSRTLVADYIGRLGEMDLLAYLAEQRPRTEVAERLGFDPFDPRRREVYRRAHRPFNAVQAAALVGGILLGLLLTLVLAGFVPRIEQTWEIRERRGVDFVVVLPVPIHEDRKTLLKEQANGYGWLFASEPDSPRVEIARAPIRSQNPGWSGSVGEEVTYQYASYRRDYSWFFGWSLVMWISIVIITAIAVVRLRGKPWSAERYTATSVRAEPASAPDRPGD